ncbi:Malate synthase, glyoxysomal [Arachis hypogaea]|nr:Malate synthase, glyoxysomal [Arachis hypogaea]
MDTGTYGYPKQGVKKIDPSYDVPEGVDIRGRYDEEFAKILTKDALKFVAELQREFRSHIRYALECRKEAKRRYNEGALPGFNPATRYIREGEWVCAPVPPAVADRKVEITGPVERKMVINALNSGAKVFMIQSEPFALVGFSPFFQLLLPLSLPLPLHLPSVSSTHLRCAARFSRRLATHSFIRCHFHPISCI